MMERLRDFITKNHETSQLLDISILVDLSKVCQHRILSGRIIIKNLSVFGEVLYLKEIPNNQAS